MYSGKVAYQEVEGRAEQSAQSMCQVAPSRAHALHILHVREKPSPQGGTWRSDWRLRWTPPVSKLQCMCRIIATTYSTLSMSSQIACFKLPSAHEQTPDPALALEG